MNALPCISDHRPGDEFGAGPHAIEELYSMDDAIEDAEVAIDRERGTVKKGMLWYEENLPAETLLWGLYALSASMNTPDDDSRDAAALAEVLPGSGTLLQLGGKAGVGRGLVRFLTPRA